MNELRKYVEQNINNINNFKLKSVNNADIIIANNEKMTKKIQKHENKMKNNGKKYTVENELNVAITNQHKNEMKIQNIENELVTTIQHKNETKNNFKNNFIIVIVFEV